MKAIKILSIILCVSVLTCFAQTNDTGGNVKSFKVSGGGKVNVTLLVGSVRILTWDKNEVAVRAEDVGEDEDLPFDISQSGSTINIKNSIGVNRDNADIQITVPSEFSVFIKTYQGDIKLLNSLKGNFQASTGGGNITLSDVNGYVNIKTFGGNISTSIISGDAVISTNGGNIHADNISGKSDISTMGGNIVLKDVGKNANVKTNGGDISIRNIGGNADVMTYGGSISIQKVAGTASIKTNGGDIKLNGASSYVDAETKGGDIELHNVYGSIKAETMSGDIYAELKSSGSGNSNISTLNGGIKLFIDPKLKVTINAKSVGNGTDDDKSIRSDFPAATINISSNTVKAVYQLNGGGVLINLSAINDVIEIRRLKK